MENDTNAEKYFFKYAFPCSHIILQKGKISQEEFNGLKNKFSNGLAPDRKTLERIFPTAFSRIKRLAERMNKDMWDFEVIKEYWENEHNRLIDNNEDGFEKEPDSLKELCRIKIAEIVEKKGDMIIIRDKNDERVVFNNLVKDAKVGDKIKIHYAYAIEKIS